MNNILNQFSVEHNDLNFVISQTLNCLSTWDDVYNDWHDKLSELPEVWNKATLREMQDLILSLATIEVVERAA